MLIILLCITSYFPILITAQVPWPGINVFNNNGISSGTYLYTNVTSVSAPYGAGTLKISNTAQVDFKAGHYVRLRPGFAASNFSTGGKFRAYIAPNDFEVVLISPTAPIPAVVEKYEKLEMGIDLPSNVNQMINNYFANNANPNGINPYDPERISVEATFISPSGTQNRTIYGFYYRDYYVSNNNWVEKTVSNGFPSAQYKWRVRFAPTEIGTWKCNIKVISPLFSTLTVNDLSFDCVPGSNKGYLQVGLHKRQFKFQDGGSFYAIGQNIPWPNAWNKVADYDHFSEYNQWVNNLGESGGNFVRVVMAPWGHAIEFEKLGDYDGRQKMAWELDQTFDICKRWGMYIYLCMEMHTQYEILGAYPNQSLAPPEFQWYNNPYNSNAASNNSAYTGVTLPRNVLESAAAKKYFKRRLRYIVSRWGYSTNLGIYEILSEQNNWASYADYQDQSVSWHSEMADYIRNPNYLGEKNHLLSTSFAAISGQSYGKAYNLPSMNVTSIHSYTNDKGAANMRYNNLNNNGLNLGEIGTIAQWDKPSNFGEMGMSSDKCDNAPKSTDQAAIEECNDISFHNALWSTAFMGGFGAGLNWWTYQYNFARRNFLSMKVFFEGMDFESNQFIHPHKWRDFSNSIVLQMGCKKCSFFGNRNNKLEVFSLTNFDKKKSIGWAHNATNWWGNVSQSCVDANGLTMPLPCDNDDYTAPVVLSKSDKIHIEGMAIGKNLKLNKYDVKWYSTQGSGGHIQTNVVKVNIFGQIKLPMPTIANTYDYAFKVSLNGVPFSKETQVTEVNELADIDTLTCPLDTIKCEGVYGEDVNGVFSYQWNFGNGKTSTLAHPTIYYQNPGLYTVTLIVTNNQGVKDTLIQRVLVPNCNLKTILDDETIEGNDHPVHVSPNPNSGFFTISLADVGIKDVFIYNMMGQIVFTQSSTKDNVLNIDLADFPKGMYLIKVINEKKCQTTKVVVE